MDIVVHAHGFVCSRVLDNGMILAVCPLTFGRARITLGTDYSGYHEAW